MYDSKRKKKVHMAYSFETKEPTLIVIISAETVAQQLSFATRNEDKPWTPQFKDDR
jgi:hypothetical protein